MTTTTHVTNIHGLHPTLVRAVERDPYTRGESDISVSQLISPPRLVALAEQHADEIVEDASDVLWRLMGKAMHVVLEQAGDDALTEERLFTDVLGWRVSGQFDNLVLTEERVEGWLLTDWKLTSVWAVKEGVKLEWEAQLNLYAHLLREAGFQIRELEIGALIRDWRLGEARQYGHEYPPIAQKTLPVPLWSPEEAESYLVERVRLHQLARETLPECSPEERWQRPDSWAVLKEGRKSALRVLDSEENAWTWVLENGHAKHSDQIIDSEVIKVGVVPKRGILVGHRPGTSARCESYCPVGGPNSNLCSQWMAIREGAA